MQSASYTYKVWIADDKERFEYGNRQTKKKDLPFAESLIGLLYFDIWSLGELFVGMGKSLTRLYETKDQCYADEVLSALNTVAKKHIFFELLRFDWQERLANAKARNYVDIVDLLLRLGKYYLVDTGIRNLLLTSTTADLCHLIENVVYLELLRPGNKVSIGKLAEK